MEHIVRENSLPKRGRKALSEGSSAERPPLFKKPKHCRSSPDTKVHPNALSEDDNIMQDKKYPKDLVSIRHAVEELQFMGRNFYQDQQKRYEDIQSLGREFHRLQQKQYDGLIKWIDDTERRAESQLRNIKQLKHETKTEPNEEKEDPDTLSRMGGHTMGGILPDKRGICVKVQDAEERAAPISPTLILPRGKNLMDNGRQSLGDFSLIGEAGKLGQMSEPVSPIKSAPLRLHNTWASKSPTPSICVDPSDGDDEDNGSFEDFRVGRSPQDEAPQSVGLLNDDGAIEGMDIGPESPDVEVKYGQQNHSPSATLPLGRDQTRSRTTSRNTTPTPDRAGGASPHPGRSLRKRRSIDYYKMGPSIDEIDELNASPLNETPSKASPKTPVRRKARKKGDETHTPLRKLESTVKSDASRKKSVKFSGGMKPGSMDKFVVRQTPNRGPAPIATPSKPPPRETDDDQLHILPDTENNESELAPANQSLPASPGTSQLGTPSKNQLTGGVSQALRTPLNKSTTICSEPKSFGGQLSDTATAVARYRAVRTSTTPLIH